MNIYIIIIINSIMNQYIVMFSINELNNIEILHQILKRNKRVKI